MNHSSNDNNAIHNRTTCTLPRRIRSRTPDIDTTTSRSRISNSLDECNYDSPISSTRHDVRTVQPKLLDASQFVDDMPKFQFASDWKFSPTSSSSSKKPSIPRAPRRSSLGSPSPRRSIPPRYTKQQQSQSRLLGGNRSNRKSSTRNSLGNISNSISNGNGNGSNSPNNNISPRLSPTLRRSSCCKSSRRRLSITSKLFRQQSASQSKIFRSSTSERTLRAQELYNSPDRLLEVPFL